jgi:multimeric flavodoxin WrbA
MRALVLNGGLGHDPTLALLQQAFEDDLAASGWETESWFLHDSVIAPCQSCYSCWVRTPGECATDDDGRRVAAAAVTSDLIVALTPVTFGGYSSQLKKALDRLIPDVSPMFESIDGETRHKRRYQRYPDLVVVGTQATVEADAKQTFVTLVARNAINFHAVRHAAVVVAEGAPPAALRTRVEGLLAQIGATSGVRDLDQPDERPEGVQ